MRLIEIEDAKLKSLIGKLMVSEVVSYQMSYEDCISWDSRCKDGYKMQNRNIRVFDPETAIDEIQEYIDTFEKSFYGGRPLNVTKHEELIDCLKQYIEFGGDDDFI